MKCRECFREFPAKLIAPFFMSRKNETTELLVCPLCALLLRNSLHGQPITTPFDGTKAKEKWNEAAKLYPPNSVLPSIAHEWRDFCIAIGLYRVTHEQRHEMQKAFYAGNLMLYNTICNSFLTATEEEAGNLLKALQVELQEFNEAAQAIYLEENTDATPTH